MRELLGVGVDLVDIERISVMRSKHGDRLCGSVFFPSEMEYCLSRFNPDESLAARFAAKEAVMKAFGTGWTSGISFMGIEVISEWGTRPEVQLHGATREHGLRVGAGVIHLSLSHSRTMAIAHVVIEKRRDDVVVPVKTSADQPLFR